MPSVASYRSQQLRRAEAAGGIAFVLVVCFVVLGVATTRGATLAADRTIILAVHGWTTAFLTVAMQGITELGAWYVTIPVCALQAVAYYRHDARLSAVALVLAIGSAPVVVDGFKLAFARPRPDVFARLIVENGFSYPSGHAAMATVAYGFSALLLIPRVRTTICRVAVLSAAITLVLLVGLSRIYLGVHYPSDVVGGILLGLAWISAWFGLLQYVRGVGLPTNGWTRFLPPGSQ